MNDRPIATVLVPARLGVGLASLTDKQPREVTAVLAELGFHWNNKRQVWQHPCGALTEGTDSDPRQKYPTYFPSDAKPA